MRLKINGNLNDRFDDRAWLFWLLAAVLAAVATMFDSGPAMQHGSSHGVTVDLDIESSAAP